MLTERLRAAIIAGAEAREALNGLPDDAPDTDRAAAVTRLADADRELREATAAEPAETADPLATDPTAPSAEERERREIRSRTRMGDYVRAAIQGRPVEGAAAEFAAACGCPGQMPLEAFGEPAAPAREVRADAVTPGPAANTSQMTSPILPAVFRASIGADLGIEMPTVAAGQAVYPVITQSVTAAPAAGGAGRDATAATITPQALKPGRITGSVVWKKEDAALLGDLDTALVGDLQAVLRDAYDAQLVAGDGTAPNLRGLSSQLPLAAAGTDAAATTWAVLVARAAAQVDGLYSEMFSDLRAVMSVEAYAYLAALFRADETENTALDWLMMKFGSVRASGRIEQTAQTATDGARSPVFVRRARPVGRVAVAPVWQGVSLIRDEISGASQGTVKVTADMLVGGIAFLRPSAFSTFTVATGAKQ
ncbi:MAG: phage major capsid protein [Caldilineaceae bacterium]|nr:phage major capsid protein [Caldilineaceae bacterium]